MFFFINIYKQVLLMNIKYYYNNDNLYVVQSMITTVTFLEYFYNYYYERKVGIMYIYETYSIICHDLTLNFRI